MKLLMHSCLLAAFLLAAPLHGAFAQQVGSGSVQLVQGGAQQNFDTLAADGTSSVLPSGWYFHESGSNANNTYAASDGNANSGNTYSLGAAGSSDRAFGTLFSNSLNSVIGARIENATAGMLSEVDIQYFGEQWRLGTSPRTEPDRLDFQYSVNASSLLDGAATWVPVSALTFSGPVLDGGVGPRDGNLPANRTLVSGSIEGLSIAPGATFWIRWVDFNAPGADDALGIDDFIITVGGEPPVDVPPTVSGTVPSDGAINVLLDSTLSVSFSEPVSLGDPWFTLLCDMQSIAASTSGGPVNYSITPDALLPSAADCLLTIIGDAVTDLDGDPDTMKEDVEVAFATLDIDNVPPPEVVSVQPVDGASAVTIASQVVVNFNETVSVSSSGFALACDNEPVAGSVSGSGSVWRLTPASLLAFDAFCQFTVFSSEVSNGFGVTMEGDVSTTFTVIGKGETSAYYAPVNTSSPAQLKCSLHQVIRGHQVFPYSGAGINTWTILETVQRDPADPDRIIDSYRNRSYLQFTDRSGQPGPGPKYNREHTWPRSLGFPNQTDANGLPNAPFTDTHMLHLTDEGQNAARGNRPLVDCPAGCTELSTEFNNGVGGGSGVYPGNSNWVSGPDGINGNFEVWGHRKGDIARAVMYMAVRYEGGTHPVTGQVEPDLELTDNRNLIGGSNPAYMGLLSDMLAWHQADPPTEEERIRNDIIQAFQGNRNPFVDHPEWASMALFTVADPDECILIEVDVIFADGFE